MTSFHDLGLATPILSTLAAENYTTPTPIQAQAIPHVLAGRDLMGIARTGTGKTAAFALPILQRLAANRHPAPRGGCRALVLSPTRELASQIAESFRTYGRHLRLATTTVFGGVAHGPQVKAMAAGPHILVATPGRLLDHMGGGTIRLDHVEVFVLDEADQMLDLGFILPIRRIIASLPAVRQNLCFSATMPAEIGKLAADLLKDPVRVAVSPAASTVEQVAQSVILVDGRHKPALLTELLADRAMARTLVFTRTKHGADKLTRHLASSAIEAAAIHGNKSQSQRERALRGFRVGRTRVLVATDIAARGIDVEGVTHVINFDLPNIPESYVHRIGRTARAGASGVAISFCGADEHPHLRGIETLIRQRLPMTDRRDNPPAATSQSRVAPAVGSAARLPSNQKRGQSGAAANGHKPRLQGSVQRPKGKRAGAKTRSHASAG